MARSRRPTQFNTQGLMNQFADQQTGEANANAEPRGIFDPSTDPLGIGLQGRAREADITQRLHGGSSPIGPLPDPRWQGWFQALQEAGGGKPVRLAQDAPRPQGLAGEPGWWAQGDAGAHAQLPSGPYGNFQPQQPSNQVGTPSLNSLYRRR